MDISSNSPDSRSVSDSPSLCDGTLCTAKGFMAKYFTAQSDLSLTDVLPRVCAYATQQWYSVPYDPAIPFVQGVYLTDFAGLATGKVLRAIPPSKYLRDLISTLLEVYASLPDKRSATLTTTLQTIEELPNLDDVLPFPSIRSFTLDSVVLDVPYTIDPSCSQLIALFQHNILPNLHNFYQDKSGTYTVDGTFHPVEEVSFVRKSSSPNSMRTFTPPGSSAINIGFTYTLEVKMTFMMMLRYMTVNQQAFNTMTLSQYRNVVAGPSVPTPAKLVSVPDIATQCTSSSNLSRCDCLYYVMYDIYECPGFGYYFCQFYESCKCAITRAVPFYTPLKDRVDNKFGKCFDINCADQPHPSDCASQCELAKKWFTSPNWTDDFINPAAVDIDLIEKTCNFKVPQFSFKTNAYFWSWKIIVGGMCMVLCVPILVAIESWKEQRVSLRFIHIIAFLLTILMVGVFGYAFAGIQTCPDFGTSVQATCVDRLTHKIQLSHTDCDIQNPIFCQCDASRDAMKSCINQGLPSCKCQNNQMCVSEDGQGDILQQSATQKQTQAQLVYICVGVYLLVSTLIGFGLHELVHRMTPLGEIPVVSFGTNITLHIVMYIVLFVIIVVFPVVWKYAKDLDPYWEINTTKQTQSCA